MDYKLQITNKYKKNNPVVSSKYYDEFRILDRKYWRSLPDAKLRSTFTGYINDYEFIVPQDFMFMKSQKFKEIYGKRKLLIRDVLQPFFKKWDN